MQEYLAQEYDVPQQYMTGFERSWVRFAALLDDLADPGSGPQTLDGLESFLTERSREVMRQVEQDQLDQLAAAEQRRGDVVDAEGRPRVRVEAGHARHVCTVFGEVKVACPGDQGAVG